MIFLYSPIPPANTGTAVYMRSLLRHLEAAFGAEVFNHFVLAIDTCCEEDQISTAQVFGWQARDFRSILRSGDDICVYFLASNAYHHYCHAMLATHQQGRCISIIHDLTAGPCLHGIQGFAGSPHAGLMDVAFSECGSRARAITRDFEHVHNLTKSFICAQGITLARSDVIITHSYYAKAKLILDYGLSEEAERMIAVCAHPEPDLPSNAAGAVAPPTSTTAPRFTVGSLGYYSPMKRFESIVQAWARFLERKPQARHSRLLLGGDISLESRARLVGFCPSPLQQTIEFTAFLSEQNFVECLQGLDLLVALRFPTCGETSGVIAHAKVSATPIAVSDFGAFREEPAAFRISVTPAEEIAQLAEAFDKAFDAWQSQRRLANCKPETSHGKLNLAETLGQITGLVSLAKRTVAPFSRTVVSYSAMRTGGDFALGRKQTDMRH
jgi:glycosyltransferase involved in cell wall biosynthesis